MTRLKNLVVKLAALVTGLALVLSAQAQTVTYFHNDMAGTPMVATDASGAVVWKESYQPYGERLHRQAAGVNNQIWFAGKPQDANTGLTYMGARYYDPVVGRFMGVDPVGFNEDDLHSFNRYAYANNNPYKFADPDGRSPALIVNLALRALAWVGARQAGAVAVAEVAAGAATGAMVPGVAVEQGAAKLVGEVGAVAAKEAELTAAQLKNVERFRQKLPANAKDSLGLKALPNEGFAAQATSPGRILGSSAVYEKQIDSRGKTTQYTKTTYDPAGNIVHVKDKIGGGVFP